MIKVPAPKCNWLHLKTNNHYAVFNRRQAVVDLAGGTKTFWYHDIAGLPASLPLIVTDDVKAGEDVVVYGRVIDGAWQSFMRPARMFDDGRFRNIEAAR